jgi:hypothetical protein
MYLWYSNLLSLLINCHISIFVGLICMIWPTILALWLASPRSSSPSISVSHASCATSPPPVSPQFPLLLLACSIFHLPLPSAHLFEVTGRPPVLGRTCWWCSTPSNEDGLCAAGAGGDARSGTSHGSEVDVPDNLWKPQWHEPCCSGGRHFPTASWKPIPLHPLSSKARRREAANPRHGSTPNPNPSSTPPTVPVCSTGCRH